MIAESLQPKDIDDSFRYLFKLDIYDFALSHSAAFDLHDFSSSSKFRILLRELVFSRIILSFCSILLKLWLKEKNLSVPSESTSTLP
jgi:hypothetical protein